jgi:hypothetical protein
MTAPLAPQSRATSADGTASEPANESVFPEKEAISAVAGATGWDPYEVWRTRVFAAQPPGNKKR